jgi:hypothetical protein
LRFFVYTSSILSFNSPFKGVGSPFLQRLEADLGDNADTAADDRRLGLGTRHPAQARRYKHPACGILISFLLHWEKRDLNFISYIREFRHPAQARRYKHPAYGILILFLLHW